jgi:hypothetical protein
MSKPPVANENRISACTRSMMTFIRRVVGTAITTTSSRRPRSVHRRLRAGGREPCGSCNHSRERCRRGDWPGSGRSISYHRRQSHHGDGTGIDCPRAASGEDCRRTREVSHSRTLGHALAPLRELVAQGSRQPRSVLSALHRERRHRSPRHVDDTRRAGPSAAGTPPNARARSSGHG